MLSKAFNKSKIYNVFIVSKQSHTPLYSAAPWFALLLMMFDGRGAGFRRPSLLCYVLLIAWRGICRIITVRAFVAYVEEQNKVNQIKQATPVQNLRPTTKLLACF